MDDVCIIDNYYNVELYFNIINDIHNGKYTIKNFFDVFNVGDQIIYFPSDRYEPFLVTVNENMKIYNIFAILKVESFDENGFMYASSKEEYEFGIDIDIQIPMMLPRKITYVFHDISYISDFKTI
jgi:hypothetical protein